ncbi:hypothetical protein, partial [Escherichia coli]
GGYTAWSFWLAILCNVVILQALWSRRVRTRPRLLCLVSAAVLVGMWCERYMLIVTPETHPHMPSMSSEAYLPTVWDWAL